SWPSLAPFPTLFRSFSLSRRGPETVEAPRVGDAVPRWPTLEGRPVTDLLLAPTRIYVKPLLALMREVKVKAMAHITGGGITENLPRVLPEGVHAAVDVNAWQQGALFDWLAEKGRIDPDEMRR